MRSMLNTAATAAVNLDWHNDQPSAYLIGTTVDPGDGIAAVTLGGTTTLMGRRDDLVGALERAAEALRALQ